MKSLSKLHQEAVLKAKTEQDKIKAAANAMIETPMDMIRAILLKHEQADVPKTNFWNMKGDKE